MVQTTNRTSDLIGASAGTGDWLDLRSPHRDPKPQLEPQLEAHRDPDDDSDRRHFDTDGRLLRELRDLVAADPTEVELVGGVKRAREGGWSWTPIAIVLGCSRNDAIRRFSRGVKHPCARRRPATTTG